MELYNSIIDTLTRYNLDFNLLSHYIVLLFSFLGGDRFISQCYQDLMAIIYKYGRLSIFITFTANFKWDEITRKLLLGQTATDRPDLVIYIFCIKVTHLLYNLKRKQIFGQYCGSIQTIKYQKWGLLYLYLLLFLYPYDCDRLLDLAVINHFISIELLQPEDNPTSYLTNIIKLIIVYSPYSFQNPRAPYIVALGLGLPLTYLKRYSKRFNPTTVIYKDGYLEYRRYNNLWLQSICLLGGAIFKIDNYQIILYLYKVY